MTGNRWLSSERPGGDDYDRRFSEKEQAGDDVHGEATFVAGLHPVAVLDAGCGTGRVAVELARRGVDVVGVDLDPGMLEAARRKAPSLDWRLGDLAGLEVTGHDGRRRLFDVVVMAGNVMIFLQPGTEGAVVAAAAGHLAPAGRLVAGFQLGPERLSLAAYDELCRRAGLELAGRWSTWDRQPWQEGGDYAVSVHRRPGGAGSSNMKSMSESSDRMS